MTYASSRIVLKSTVYIKENVLPVTQSPFVTGPALGKISSDGAVSLSLVPIKAYAKYAIPKGLPSEGQRSLAIENEPHLVDDFDGEIVSGYGKGTKTLLLSGQVVVKVGGRSSVQKLNYHVHDAERAGRHFDVVVTGVEPGTKQWEMNIPRGEYKGRYAFVTTNNRMLVTRMKDNGVQIPKPVYTLRQEEKLDHLIPSENSVERKYDGSLGNALVKDYRVYFRSHRDEGETYHDKLPAVEFIRSDSKFFFSRRLYPGPSLNGTIFQGELTHPDGSARVSGILNSLAPNARAMQEQRGPVDYYVWDILKHKGRDVSNRPYEERRDLYTGLVQDIRKVNRHWHAVERMANNETPQSFYERVILDPLPYGEGVVIKPLDSSESHWDKIKMHGFHYYKLYDILPGVGKYGRTVGRLVVENRSNGARGEVGSLSVPDDFRDWIWDNRDILRGETVKVRAQEVTSRGVPRAGVFIGFHDSEVDLLMSAEAKVAGTNRDPLDVVYAMKSKAGWRNR